MSDAVGRLTELDRCQTSLLPDQVSSSSSSSSLSRPLNLLLSDQVTRSKLSSVLPPEISRDKEISTWIATISPPQRSRISGVQHRRDGVGKNFSDAWTNEGGSQF